jgi:hypothetical protein
LALRLLRALAHFALAASEADVYDWSSTGIERRYRSFRAAPPGLRIFSAAGRFIC